MKIQILKVLVLLVSISAASVLVWNATRDKKSASHREESVFDPDNMQVGSKSGPVMLSEDIEEIVATDNDEKHTEDLFKSKITDEEVKKTREMMMMSSKSGLVMSEDEVRKMLEERAEKKSKQEPPAPEPHLMHSSKAFIGPIIEKGDLEKIIEGKKEQSEVKLEPKPLLMSSSKSSAGILNRHDLEKIIEDDKKQSQPE